jgi:hypothetical protein
MVVKLRNGKKTKDPRLDRLPSKTVEHLEKYPLTAKTMPSKASSMMVAVNWYENFDAPVETTINGVRRFVIGEGNLGRIRGGHAVCARNWNLLDVLGWYLHYNQGTEGRCVEFASLRLLTHMNRKRYDITSKWHYHMMQETDEWPGCYLGHGGPAYEGTSGRAGLEILRAYGAIPWKRVTAPVDFDQAAGLAAQKEGVSAYRWALNWQDVRSALQVPDSLPGIPINNSWGESYPREVILLDAAGERLLSEDGEFGIVTDK